MYMLTSGSFIAVLYLTIDSAPTKPNERANEDFTIVITIMIVTANIMKFLEKACLFDIALPYLT